MEQDIDTGSDQNGKKLETIAIVGIGRVGLPLAISFAASGLRVHGLDRNAEHVAKVNHGELPFIEHGASEVLQRVVKDGSFSATVSASTAISSADAVIVTVGTPLGADLRADTSQVEAALAEIAPFLKRGVLVVMRSTLSPGTTERIVIPTLERITDLRIGDDLQVAFCPERIAEGNAMEELATLPEIVGAIDAESARSATDLFKRLAADKKIQLTDPLSAELAKLFTNVYRYVTFALANEYALIAEHYERDAHHIIATLRHDYPRAPVPLPGPAGGPCLSKDGYFLIEELTFPDFVLTAWKLNDSVPAHLVARLSNEIRRRGHSPSGSRVTVLGTAFKADIDDDRQSPSLRAIDALRRTGFEVSIHDPYLAPGSVEDAVAGSIGIILATNHSQYQTLDPERIAAAAAPDCVVADAWAMLDPDQWQAAGLTVLTFGRG
jgi:UDP-N-acetyl-D-mannosaminuronic acid dehydrogenase